MINRKVLITALMAALAMSDLPEVYQEAKPREPDPPLGPPASDLPPDPPVPGDPNRIRNPEAYARAQAKRARRAARAALGKT